MYFKKGKHAYFIPKYYKTRLIEFFYNGEEIENTDIWSLKWKKAACNFNNITFENPNENDQPPCHGYKKSWQFVVTPKWIMPVTISQYSDFLKSEKAFCPNTLKKSDDRNYVLPSVYKIKLFGENEHLPLCYKGKIENKPVKIYLHGTLDPRKWHYGIRCHMLNNSGERKWWESWLGGAFDIDSGQLFQDCPPPTQKNCGGCSLDQFQKINENNAFIDLRDKYWNKAVTFWESETTKKTVKREPHGTYDSFEILIFKKELLNTNGEEDFKYPLLVLNGWSYDYDPSVSDEAILHVNILTFYIKNGRPRIEVKELKDVQRL